MSAFFELGYREDGSEEVEHVQCSVTTDAYRNRLACRPLSVAPVRVTPIGDAALERIYRVLKPRRMARGR
jgi:propanediol dehydratase small subunit